MKLKRVDQLKPGDIVRLGVHTAPIVRIIRESPRVLLVHLETGRPSGPFVYRKLVNTLVQLIGEQ